MPKGDIITLLPQGDGAQIQTAAKPESAIEKGLAGPGLLAYIVTSKFSDYLPLYRLEDIFERQGFEISRATQSVWCAGVADVVEPLYGLMADRVRDSHVVPTDDTIMPMRLGAVPAGQPRTGSIRALYGVELLLQVSQGRRRVAPRQDSSPGNSSCCRSIPWRRR